MRIGNRELRSFFEETSRDRVADTGPGAGRYQGDLVL
jgi:hypothetical protein